MALAWLGVIASLLLVVGLPLQLAGFIAGPGTSSCGKGVAVPARVASLMKGSE